METRRDFEGRAALTVLAGAAIASAGIFGLMPKRREKPAAAAPSGGAAASEDRPFNRFPNVVLRTQDDATVRFYDDLVKGRTVLINFMYTTCTGSCPGTSANLAKVQDALGDRLGRDVLMLSISLDPEHDTPRALADYAAAYGAKPGWLFLTGAKSDVETLRRRLGVVDPDPAVDADKTQHAGVLVFGNEPRGWWSSTPGLAPPDRIADSILRVADGPSRKPAPVKFD